ncbi:MAG: SiaC family regulatory phosphoprotein [Bacteroidia bacterium]
MYYQVLATSATPFVGFDPDRNMLILEGLSVPEDPKSFYLELRQKVLQANQASSLTYLTVVSRLFYVNTSSIRELYEMFQAWQEAGIHLELIIQVEDEDSPLHEFGEVCQTYLGIPVRVELLSS